MIRKTRIERWTEEIKEEDGAMLRLLKPKEAPKPRVKKKEVVKEKATEKRTSHILRKRNDNRQDIIQRRKVSR